MTTTRTMPRLFARGGTRAHRRRMPQRRSHGRTPVADRSTGRPEAGAADAPGGAHRRREGRRQPHDHRPAPRLVQLRRPDRHLQREDRPHVSTASTRTPARAGDRCDQGQPERRAPGPGRHRRRPLVRPVGEGRRPAPGLQGRDLGQHSRTRRRTPTASGTATTTASWRSRSTRTSQAESPKDWADLLKPEYANQVALAGDPLNSNQAIQAVQAAALANGGGSTTPSPASTSSSSSTTRATSCPWPSSDARQRRDPDRHHLDVHRARRQGLHRGHRGHRGRRAGGRQVRRGLRPGDQQTAPHPNAAKLWMEYLYSDEGQLWLTTPTATRPATTTWSRGTSFRLT